VFVGACGIGAGAAPCVLYLTDANGFFGSARCGGARPPAAGGGRLDSSAEGSLAGAPPHPQRGLQAGIRRAPAPAGGSRP
jgi:hypothetical protein